MPVPANPPLPLSGISSMATRALLAELATAWSASGGPGRGRGLRFESVGGVDAARRVAAGEVFDLVVLAAEAIDKLVTSGAVLPGSRVDLVRSPVAVAVPHGAPRPAIDSAAAVRAAVQAARAIGYSTGPSGVALQQLFVRWGLSESVAARTVQAAPGVPVAELIARGEVTLGFQQLSELQGAPGVDVLGLLPEEIAHISVFAGALPRSCRDAEAATALLAWLAGPDTAAAKRRHGMQPA